MRTASDPSAVGPAGNAYRELGELQESIRCYRQALALNPRHPHALNNLANSLKDRGECTRRQ
jgi:Flp pilus assembly protein TadD